MEQYAPVVVFAYKRLDKLRQCLAALGKNALVGRTDLYIFSDGPKGENDEAEVKAVRKYLREFGEKSLFRRVQIIESEKNKGLANSIISGVSHVIETYGKAIVVEDDLIVSEDFISFMNRALDFYGAYSEYGSISGYTLPIRSLKHYDKDVYVLRKGECWGWATWEDRWKDVDWQVKSYKEYCGDKKARKEFNKLQNNLDDMLAMQMEGKLDSWAVRWCYHLFTHQLLTVYPTKSRVKNVGNDGSGTHGTPTDIYDMELERQYEQCVFERLNVNRQLERETANFEIPSRIQYICRISVSAVRRKFRGGHLC